MVDQVPVLDEASSAAPTISPGIVSDCECLLRELYSPQHTSDGAGDGLTVRAIQVKELIRTGVSVHRMEHVSAERVKGLIDERVTASRSTRTSLGVARIPSGTVRRLRLKGDPETQQLVVIDTGTIERPWHASIFAKKNNAKQSHARQLRNLLLPLLQQHMMTVDQAYAFGEGT